MRPIGSARLLLMLSLSVPLQAQDQPSLPPLPIPYLRGVLQKVDSLLETKYVLADRAKQYAEEFRARSASGVYDSCATAGEFADRVRRDLVDITGDRHTNFRVVTASDAGEKPEGPLHHPVRYYHLRKKEHTGFTKLEWINGRIGYLELRRFNMLSEARELMQAAVTFLREADAIIIDVRENGGGMGDYLSSYFLPHPTQLTGAYYREGNVAEESWTAGTLAGQRMLDVPVFILTSRKTFSAAEAFAYDMKVRGRATLIGDSTGGGAHDTQYFRIDDRFELYLSVGRGINPVTLTNWEGIGVIPDVLVPASSALDTAIVRARAAGAVYGERKAAALQAAVKTMEWQLGRAEQLYGAKRNREGKAALDSMFAVGMHNGLITEFFNYVLASGYGTAATRPLLIAILQKSTELFPDSPSAYETLASAYLDGGQKDLALEQYRKLLAIDPENVLARKRLREL